MIINKLLNNCTMLGGISHPRKFLSVCLSAIKVNEEPDCSNADQKKITKKAAPKEPVTPKIKKQPAEAPMAETEPTVIIMSEPEEVMVVETIELEEVPSENETT